MSSSVTTCCCSHFENMKGISCFSRPRNLAFILIHIRLIRAAFIVPRRLKWTVSRNMRYGHVLVFLWCLCCVCTHTYIEKSGQSGELSSCFQGAGMSVLTVCADLPTLRPVSTITGHFFKIRLINTFTAIVDLSRFNNSCLKSPVSTLVHLTFQSRALRSFSLNQLRNLSL